MIDGDVRVEIRSAGKGGGGGGLGHGAEVSCWFLRWR